MHKTDTKEPLKMPFVGLIDLYFQSKKKSEEGKSTMFSSKYLLIVTIRS